jgi:G3E family GTPase
MKAIILGGFLGSGKTTALMRFARWLVERSAAENENKVIILENEIGEVGVDDKTLRASGLSVTNLFSGCACCTVSCELTSAAQRIQDDLSPEWLIVETTGVAYPKNMRENLTHALGITARIAVLCDGQRWARLLRAMRPLIEGQVQGSDAVLINKVDLADEQALAQMEADIRAMEPGAKIRRISALNDVPDAVWRDIIGE